ncbi:hypothetical protein ACFE04_001175 [Oxalis oulophora]
MTKSSSNKNNLDLVNRAVDINATNFDSTFKESHVAISIVEFFAPKHNTTSDHRSMQRHELRHVRKNIITVDYKLRFVDSWKIQIDRVKTSSSSSSFFSLDRTNQSVKLLHNNQITISKGEKPEINDVSEKAPKKNNNLHVEISTSQIDIKMPKGKIVRKIVGLELRHELVVDALLVFQFFAAFGKCLICQMDTISPFFDNCCAGTRWRNTEKISLGFLSLKAGTCKNYWLQALEMLAAKSRISPIDGFKNDPTGYEKLSACEKLKLLNFLCDEQIQRYHNCSVIWFST